MKLQRVNRYINPFHIIILGFLAVIILGSIMLSLPAASMDESRTPFIDAFFTAVSATCVTGLSVYNTAEHWSIFGQTVILLLIQIGGIGVVTMAMAISLFSGKKIGLMQRSTMQEAIGAPQVGGIVKMTGFMLKGVLLIELTGAVMLAFRFCRDFGIGKGIWYAIFHSISAFCNAGFDLMGTQNGPSLMRYVRDPLVNITTMLLILLGGIGFFTWQDVVQHKQYFHKYRLQTKIVLTVTLILVMVPAVYFFLLEFSGDSWSALSIGDKVLASFFQSVTLRTAGFNTVDLTRISEPGQFIMVLCMLVGGASGSTAGGFKMTTLAVLVLASIAVFRQREDTQCFGRRIASDSISNAAAIFMLYLSLCTVGTVLIASVEQVPFMTALFETASALATVGLSLGITGSLTVASKIVLILLMFLGRVGGLTLVYAIVSGKKSFFSHYPEEKVMVG